jgi:hypothetical protein
METIIGRRFGFKEARLKVVKQLESILTIPLKILMMTY